VRCPIHARKPDTLKNAEKAFLVGGAKNFVTFVFLTVTIAAETSDGDEADVEFIGAAWFTCIS
jgi:hypothetical protein